MKAEIRARFSEARFLEPFLLPKKFPQHYRELSALIIGQGRSFADCIFYETADGVTVTFLTSDPEEVESLGGTTYTISGPMRV